MEPIAESEGKSILQRIKVFSNYAKQVVLAWLILIAGLLILPVLSFQVFMEVSGRTATSVARVLDSHGLAAAGWALLIAFLAVVAWPFVALIVWIVKDSRKYKSQGVNTHPYLWGLGMIYPLTLIVFPLYLVKRNIIWHRKPRESNPGIGLGSVKEKSKLKRMWTRVSIIALLILFVVIPLVTGLLTQVGIRNRKVANLLVNYSLSNSCASWKSGCDELRSLPKVLQNKKIVFNKDTSIQFNPRYRPEIGLTDLDILGSLNTNRLSVTLGDIVDPSLEKLGYLSEREYKIVRAVYHYNCSYCIDSSDYAYIVLEDSKGNRFSSLLSHDYWDPSMDTARTLQWDERVPYDLGRDGELGELVDINATSTQQKI